MIEGEIGILIGNEGREEVNVGEMMGNLGRGSGSGESEEGETRSSEW